MTSITYKMRKKSTLVTRKYWLSNSLDGAEHNKYTQLTCEYALGTRLSEVIVSKNFLKKYLWPNQKQNENKKQRENTAKRGTMP